MAGAADDPYAVLGVARSATQADIKAAYQTLVGQYHPDLHQQNPLEDLAKARMVEINAAYELLSDPTRRAAYDAGFRAWTRGRGARERRAQASGRRVDASSALGLTILTIAALPLIFWVAMLVVRLLRLLLVRLFGAAGAIGGGRVAAAMVIAGVVVLVIAWRKHRARGNGEPRPAP